jgi:cell division protein FtsZ
MPTQAYASMPNVMEPAPQPVVRDDVVLTPTQPKQAMVYETPLMPEPQYEEPIAQGSFIPPQAERAMRPARMPRIDELPMPAQNQIRASRGEPALEPKPMSLLQRLATVGFGRKDEGHPEPAPQRQPEAPRQQMSPVHAEYAKRPAQPQGYRPAQGHLDPQGRMAPAPRNMEDDQLEIPAFLRRQAN